MLEINQTPKFLQLVYTYGEPSFSPDDWIVRLLKDEGEVRLKRGVFTLTPGLVTNPSRLQIKSQEFIGDYEEYERITFNIGSLTTLKKDGIEDQYYKIYPNVLVEEQEIYIHKDLSIDIDFFLAETNISVFGKIAELVNEDIVVGGSLPNCIPAEEFNTLIKNFPTTHEKKLYAQARISAVLKNYFDSTKDAETLFVKYRNKKPSLIKNKLRRAFSEYEIDKYQTIYEKLKSILDDEEDFSEAQWQKEIIDILLMLYPKYIAVFDNVHIKADNQKNKYLDYLFVDANGHIDIVEIKKPFDNAIMTGNLYRGNHIPLKELSGTVMQLEKYIYYLNRWGQRGEKKLIDKYGKYLPNGFEINITNPKGLIIMGRENNLSKAQKSDFEVVKRKYKNVIDILSYDDLFQRLKFTIEQIRSI